MFGISVEHGHQVCPILLHLWNDYLIPLELEGLECDPHHVILILPCSNRTQIFHIIPILFFGESFAKDYNIVGLVYTV